MFKFTGKFEWVLCKLSKSEILRLYSIIHVAIETTKMSNFTVNQNIFHVASFHLWSVTLLLPWFSKWHILTNCKTVFSHLKCHTVDSKTDTFGIGSKCASYIHVEPNKGSKERQGPTLGVHFTEVSIKRELAVDGKKIPTDVAIESEEFSTFSRIIRKTWVQFCNIYH